MPTLALQHSVSDILRKLLVALGLGSQPDKATPDLAWQIFIASEPERPESCITIYDTAAMLNASEMPVGEYMEHKGIQIRLRASAHTAGYAKADAVRRALDEDINYNAVTIGAATYMLHAFSRTTGVLALGTAVPTSKRHLFTINGLLALERTA